ncbi:hypothetical protein I4U23_005980 [Adineta vaga]|nr:hypothetical protein I4U23_005980 [Adineta vaga]
MNSSTIPRIRIDYPNLYPCGTIISKQIHEEDDLNLVYLCYEETDEQKNLFRKWTNELLQTDGKEKVNIIHEQYQKLFHSRHYSSRFFDLHGREFQNFALNLTNYMTQSEWRQLSLSKNHADHRLLRSRIYAIGSRDDINWNGQSIENSNERKIKKIEMIQHLKSLQLFDWFAPNCQQETNVSEICHDLQIQVIRQGTQEVVEELYANIEDKSKLIAWVNFASSHNVCGSYSVDFGGSQEEEVATNCDGAVLLGTMGQFVEMGLKSWIRGRWVAYRQGMHIPPGGNYWAMTRFVTGPIHAECGMIATAFADFRPYFPIFYPYTERSYFYSMIGHVKNQEELEQRCLIDIEGVLKTCLVKQVHTLVTGASGCGAFRHNPYIEAKLWRKCLEKKEYRNGSLKQVIFAILDRENSENWIAFRNEFIIN